MIPGEYFLSKNPIIANVGKKTIKINIKNTGDRPIQVGSHTHFFETNRALMFQRNKTFGYHLNIPSGTSLRFEPGDSRFVELTEFGGKKLSLVLIVLLMVNLQENKRIYLFRS